MYKKILVKELIEEGNRLLERLERNHFRFDAALWYYVPESLQWMFVIASPVVDIAGPMAAYARLQRLLTSIQPPLSLQLSDISLVSPQSQEFQGLRSLVAGAGRLDVGATAGPIRDVVFEDAYVYRL